MSETVGVCSCKVGRNVEKYRLDDLDAELLRRRREAGSSLRELSDYTNRRILEAALAASDVDLTDALYGAVADDDAIGVLYDALTSEDTPTERAARVRTRLGQQDADIEEIQSDWITHTTIRSHLRDCLEISTSRESSITVDGAQDTMGWARNRCANIVEQTFERLRNAGELSTGPLEVSVTIRVACTDCGSTYRPGALLSARECDCSSSGPSD